MVIINFSDTCKQDDTKKKLQVTWYLQVQIRKMIKKWNNLKPNFHKKKMFKEFKKLKIFV